MTEKRDTYTERVILCKEIVKLEKKILSKERRINKLDENSFDTKTEDFKPDVVIKMKKVEKEIQDIELIIKQLKEKETYLISIQSDVEIIL